MPILLSGTPIALTADIDGSTASTLYAGITNMLGGYAGWTGSAITNGFEYVISSPQPSYYGALQARVRIWVANSSVAFERVAGDSQVQPAVWIQFRRYLYAGVADEGYEHELLPRDGSLWFLWANACSLFIARKNTSRGIIDGTLTASRGTVEQTGNAMSGGIPYVPEGLIDPARCKTNTVVDPMEAVTDLWFSCGDRTHGLPDSVSYRENFRNSASCHLYSSSACINQSIVCPRTATLSLSDKQHYWNAGPHMVIWPPCAQGYWWPTRGSRTHWPRAYNHPPGESLYYFPWVGWGMVGDAEPRVVGVLYDILIKACGSPLDDDADIQLTLTARWNGGSWRYQEDLGKFRAYTYDPWTPLETEFQPATNWSPNSPSFTVYDSHDNSYGMKRNYSGNFLLLSTAPVSQPEVLRNYVY